MARPALATLDDLERLLGAISNEDQAQARIEQASELVRAFAGVDWLNANQDDVENVPGAIPGVVIGIVERAVGNPDGVTANSETAGPFARSFSFGQDAASRIYLTDADKRIIRHAVSGQPGVFTISTTRGILETPGPWGPWDAPVMVPTDSGEPMAWLDPSEVPPPLGEPLP